METKLTTSASTFAVITAMTGHLCAQPTPARFRGEAPLAGLMASAHVAVKPGITAERMAAWTTGEPSTNGEFPIATVNTANTTDYVPGSRYRSPLLMS